MKTLLKPNAYLKALLAAVVAGLASLKGLDFDAMSPEQLREAAAWAAAAFGGVFGVKNFEDAKTQASEFVDELKGRL